VRAATGDDDEPLVYLAASDLGGVAVIVRRVGSPQAIQLPDLTSSAVSRQVELLRAATTADTQESLDQYDLVTEWMWESVMRDVLGALRGSSSAALIPTGLLSLLPLHAAGTRVPSRGWWFALDDVVFQYAVNARTLRTSRAVAKRTQPLPVLAVENPTGDLPGAGFEVMALRETIPAGELTVLHGTEADPASVLAGLAACGTLYFAGHGLAAVPPESALDSRLLLSGGDIKVRDLLRQDLTGLRLAVLSACESARAGVSLPDEVVGLPAGLIQAGAAGVVGSLWLVDDQAALQVMRRFLELWQENGLPAAEALCEAQRWVRHHVPECAHPAQWAAFTFSGA
jgi:CHAT domain-containing protein